MQLVSVLLFSVAAGSILVKLNKGWFQRDISKQGLNFTVEYNFAYKTAGDSSFFIKAFLPQSSEHQKITVVKNDFKSGNFQAINDGNNTTGLWNGKVRNTKENIVYSFDVKTQAQSYSVSKDLSLETITNPHSLHVRPGSFIESNDPKIVALANELRGIKDGADEVLRSIYRYTNNIPSESYPELTTALEALEKNEASCNGKSRLFVALCRSLNIPARVVGGLILNEERKRTSHLWAEVLIQDKWVPFDALNGHYGYLPANYLEIYRGDEFLVKRSADLMFDYNYAIQEKNVKTSFFQQFNLFKIAAATGLSPEVLSLLMLLPFGALIVAIFRNVVGMKTFGVFLPILIAISFTSTGLFFGILSFVAVLLVISLLHYPMLKWGVLHVPKLVVMLSGVVFLLIVLLYAGMELNIAQVSGLTFFPIVILTISAEKYARIVVEEGIMNATKILFQTLLVTLFCYAIVSSEMIFLIIMNFPEILLLIAVTSLMLGKWIGLRIAEYKRFGWMIS